MGPLWSAQFGLAPALARALLHSLWQDALLALLAALLLSALAKRSAALRHAVAMGMLLAMVAVPAATFAQFWSKPAGTLNAGILPVMSPPALHAAPGLVVQESDALAGAVSLLWLLGVGAMMVRQLGGWHLVRSLDRQPFQPLPPRWLQRVEVLQRSLGISRQVVVRLASDVVAPFTARLLRPVIWLPLSLLTRLSAEQLEALLAHELAHIRRMDWLWNGLQCTLESMLFFHPGAWWLSRRIRQEREHACDDLAVAACGDAIALAEALSELERQRLPSPRLLLAAHGGALMHRITRLLSDSTSRARWHLPVGLLLLLTSGTLLAAQVDLHGGRLPSLRIQSSTEGALGPGDYRDVTARGLDGQRHYRASKDSQGRLTEVYEVDGRAAVIDSEARAWLAEIDRLSLPPPPPPPPEMPLPPPPPAMPRIEESKDFQALLQLVAQAPATAASAGSPATVVADSVGGHLRTGEGKDLSGDAELSFVLSGPKGRARVTLSGARAGGTWTLSGLDVQPE